MNTFKVGDYITIDFAWSPHHLAVCQLTGVPGGVLTMYHCRYIRNGSEHRVAILPSELIHGARCPTDTELLKAKLLGL